ncbi:MAG: RT0821/Lpp0805 family surface protein [Hyphomicrobiaceae bacterium]|nr:RT0821/Lpp0805 family surface protein [Hyphomicrobiaceae bacterium]
MRSFVVVTVPALGLLLAGCGPDGLTKADAGTAVGAVAGGILGNQVGSGTGKVLATVAGAFIGGVVGHTIGKSLDDQDRMLAQQAEFAALENGQSGIPRQWRNPDSGRYGEVVPSKPYRRAERDCRDFTHTVFISGRAETMRGTACRNPDGTWRNVG